MTLSTASMTLDSLQSLSDSESLLAALKDLKNSVIGNTWKKVEVAGDDGLKDFLLGQLSRTPLSDQVNLDIINETSVIIGALASDGPLTLRPLVLAGAPTALIELIHSLQRASISKLKETKVLSSVLRALRNILVSAADLVWGHQWGVGAEQKVVGTGLIELKANSGSGKGKGVAVREDAWRDEAFSSLASVFDPAKLSTLLSVLENQSSPQVLVPVYQLLSRLIVLPSHREALASWSPSSIEYSSGQAGPSSASLVTGLESDLSRSTPTPPASLPYILKHLVDMISDPSSVVRRSTPKVLEAALELLAALIKGQPTLATMLRSWTSKSGDPALSDSMISPMSPTPSMYSPSLEREPRIPAFLALLQDLLSTHSTSVRIASASCLAHLLKAEKNPRPATYTRLNLQLLATVTDLLKTEQLEEQVKLCFVIAVAVADEPESSRVAAEQGCPQQIITLLDTIEKADKTGTLSRDLASRGREGSLIALASLAFPLDSIRILITESEPPCLPYLLKALSHPSYGVRAAACQLARALSRTVSLVRTSLIDCGISDAIIKTLNEEVWDRRLCESETDEEDAERQHEEMWGDRCYTVEITAMMTLCNLIADFSPMKEKLLAGPGIGAICYLTNSPNEQLAMNALWTIKNAMFKSTESMKARILKKLGVDHLMKDFLAPSTSPILKTQAMGIIQNLLADGALSDLTKAVEALGEDQLIEAVASSVVEGVDLELRAAAFGVLVNLSWGNKEMRHNLTSRASLVDSLANALDSNHNEIKYPALRALRNLILIPTTKPGKPRQAMLDVFAPYALKARALELAETSGCLEVVVAATQLYELLERAREPSEVLREDVLDR